MSTWLEAIAAVVPECPTTCGFADALPASNMWFEFAIRGLSAKHVNVLLGMGPAAWCFVIALDLVLRLARSMQLHGFNRGE